MTEFEGVIADDIREARPDWSAYRSAAATPGAPNVLYLLWDDIGIATWDCYGGLVEMPNVKRISDRGIRLTQFHTTALCSPTRASLLTGRNATSVGMSSVENLAEGFPGHHGRIPAESALISEVLGERGWSTYAVGKWHLAPIEDCHAAGSRRYWPLGRGFDRFYGFLDGLTDQFHPSLVSDNHPVDPPATPEQGYHLSKDLADKAIGFLRDHRAAAPEKPWFMYLCPGAGHSPHQVAPEWADRYRGRFDMGYERYREVVLANQKSLGLLPDDTALSPMNPYADRTSVEGLPWPEGDTVTPWDSLSDNEKRVSSRMAEVFAGFLSYTDAQIGRVFDYLEDSGQLDNTIVVIMSDNGASGEGGPAGAVHEFSRILGGDDPELAERSFDTLGGPGTHMNYSTGWAMAFNTPYKLFKRYASHEGGIADPCVISWPAGLDARGAVRDAYVHVGDVTPTIYQLLDLDPPHTVKGIAQDPLEGVSFVPALQNPPGDTGKRTQFYSMMGTRGIWHDGWFAGTVHPATSGAPRGWSHFDRDCWELFHVDSDRSQIHDLAGEQPTRLEALKAMWHEHAVALRAYPLSDLTVGELVLRGAARDVPAGGSAARAVFYPDTPATSTPISGLIRGRSFTLKADVSALDPDVSRGVLFSQGNRWAGHVLYVADGHLRYVCTIAGRQQAMTSRARIGPGDHVVGVMFTRTSAVDGSFDVIGDAVLFVDADEVAAIRDMRMTGLDLMQTVTAGRCVTFPVSTDFSSPNPFVGARLDDVTIEFGDGASGAGDDQPPTAEVVAATFARD